MWYYKSASSTKKPPLWDRHACRGKSGSSALGTCPASQGGCGLHFGTFPMLRAQQRRGDSCSLDAAAAVALALALPAPSAGSKHRSASGSATSFSRQYAVNVNSRRVPSRTSAALHETMSQPTAPDTCPSGTSAAVRAVTSQAAVHWAHDQHQKAGAVCYLDCPDAQGSV